MPRFQLCRASFHQHELGNWIESITSTLSGSSAEPEKMEDNAEFLSTGAWAMKLEGGIRS
jgi:hypothetical protein